MAAAVLACIAASGAQAIASSPPVALADGTSLAVWEQRGRAIPGRGQDTSSIGYSLTDAAGIRLGVVPTTADSARGAAPSLPLARTRSALLAFCAFSTGPPP